MYNFSSFEEQAITRNSSFMTKDGREEHQKTQSCLQSKVSLSIFLTNESRCAMFPLCQVCAKALWTPETLGEVVSNNRARHGRLHRHLSHAAILLSGFVHHRGVRGVQGRGEGAQEASQQREAQSTPSAEHGPAVTVADVLRYPKHVARVAGEFKIDASHACAQGDYAAGSCQSRAQVRFQQQQQTFPPHLARHFTTVVSSATLPLRGDRGYCAL